MTLSRIWSAFIIIAVVVGLIKLVVLPEDKGIFSAMVTGKSGDTIRVSVHKGIADSASSVSILQEKGKIHHKTLQKINNQLNIIQLEVAGLKEQLQNPAADVSFLTKKLDTLIVQYNLILEAINLLFYEISNSPGSISVGLEAFLPFRNDIKNYTSFNINTTAFGGALTRDRFDEPNSAYQLNGKTDFIQTNYNFGYEIAFRVKTIDRAGGRT